MCNIYTDRENSVLYFRENWSQEMQKFRHRRALQMNCILTYNRLSHLYSSFLIQASCVALFWLSPSSWKTTAANHKICQSCIESDVFYVLKTADVVIGGEAVFSKSFGRPWLPIQRFKNKKLPHPSSAKKFLRCCGSCCQRRLEKKFYWGFFKVWTDYKSTVFLLDFMMKLGSRTLVAPMKSTFRV